MPYITKLARASVNPQIRLLANALKGAPAGTFNYAITRLLMEAYDLPESQDYATYNEIIGILECCKLEFYRKLAAPYEDVKCKQNGDVRA